MSNEIEDFGFSFFDEEEIDSKIESEVSRTELSYKEKLKQVEILMLPFLNNLSKDPQKIMIKWPNRGEVVKKQIDKLLSITRE